MPSNDIQPDREPQPHGSQDNIFVDARDVPSQQNLGDDPSAPTLEHFKANIKRKSTNVKRRFTITTNSLVPLERPDVPLHSDDINAVRKYLKSADKALDSLNEVMDDALDTFDDNEMQPFIQLAYDYTQQIMNIRARVNILQAKVDSHNLVSQSPAQGSQNTVSMQKIDNTFKPDPLDTDATPSIFQQWHDQFLVYSERNNFDHAPFKQQRILLIKCLTPAMHGALDRLAASKTATTLKELIQQLEGYITKSNNLMMRRYNYFKCVQRPGESYRDYIVRFRDVGDYAGFDNFSYDENMSCRFITGILDEELRTQLLRQPKIDFQSVQDFALSWEVTNAASGSITNDLQDVPQKDREISKISAYKSHKRTSFHRQAASAQHPTDKPRAYSNGKQGQSKSRGGGRPQQYKNADAPKQCGRCGSSPHPQGVACPATGQECSYCKAIGHFRAVCRTAIRKGIVNQVQDDNHDMSDEELPGDTDVNVIDGAIFQVDHSPQPVSKIPAEFSMGRSRHTANVLPDTGAAVSVLPSQVLQTWNWQTKVSPTTNILRSASGDNIACDGIIDLSVSVFGVSSVVAFYVCPQVKSILLSCRALKDLRIVSRTFPWPTDVLQVHHPEIDMYKKSLFSAFSKVFAKSNVLAPMHGTPMVIHLKNNIDWSSISNTFKPRPIPIPLRAAARAEIDSMIEKNIIVPVEKPTTFVSPMLVVPKKGNAVRLVIDYTQLNRHIRRPVHPFPSVQEVRAMIPPTSKYFATMDALQGYWQVPLHPSSQELTTFMTPWGRFCFTRAPMGLSSSGDEYCRRGDIAFAGIKNVIKVVDDVLVHASTLQELKETVHQVLTATQSNGISLSPEKLSIGQSVTFVGLNITADGISPDPKHLQAISQFPRPKNKTDLRSFLGLVNQFAAFSKHITKESSPLRPLLSSGSVWHWDDNHEQSFLRLRKLLVESPILQYFSPHLETQLLTDASCLNGLGYILMQKNSDKWSLVSCGSRTINAAEANYATCELEALAIVWAIQRCRIFLVGLPMFQVITDHRPLVTIFNSQRLLKNDNPRLLRLVQKVASYTFTVRWVPGKLHRVPDALSRAPLPINSVQDDIQDTQIQQPTVRIADLALAKLSEDALLCEEYKDLSEAVTRMSLHDVNKLPIQTHGHIRAFRSIWDRLSLEPQSGLVLLDASRIVVPRKSRSGILQIAHASHQGISRTKARLQALYFWHGMTNDVTQIVQSCTQCSKFKQSQPSQPLMDPKVPEYPFQMTSCDLFDYQGSFTLVYVDCFSGFPLVSHFHKSPSSAQLIHALSNCFKDFGIPQSLRHDGAQPFVSREFVAFLANNNITDELSAAYNPQSNGHAEAAVKAVKLLVKKSWLTCQMDPIKFNNSLLEWHNTPRLPGLLSPAELLFSRKIRTLLPTINHDHISNDDIMSAIDRNYDTLKRAYKNINSRRRHLPPLNPGDPVLIRDVAKAIWDKKGTIISSRKHGRSYFVRSNGKTFLRTRRHLKRTSTSTLR